MAGIMSSLKAHHSGSAFSEQVNHLAFALITPLGTDYNYVLTHFDRHTP
jgi:hypothetical protein